MRQNREETPVPLVLETPHTLRDLVGRELTLTDWFPIAQERIEQFAEGTEDRQWIPTARTGCPSRVAASLSRSSMVPIACSKSSALDRGVMPSLVATIEPRASTRAPRIAEAPTAATTTAGPAASVAVIGGRPEAADESWAQRPAAIAVTRPWHAIEFAGILISHRPRQFGLDHRPQVSWYGPVRQRVG